MDRIIPKSNRRVVMMLLAVILTAATAWSQESTTFSGGDGTVKNPYIITTSSDWSQLATNVAAGTSYSDQYFRLDEDITVTTMVGTGTNINNAKSFSGTFDGNGHKLTVNYEGSDDIATAPFRFLSNATIKNLHVDGVITSSHKYVAGLAGRTYGTTLIEGCRISTIIRSSVNGDATHGGIVALKPNSSSAKLTIEGCVFDGKILTTNGTTCCGGFVGYTSYGSLTIKNSIYAPAAPADGETAVNDGCTFYRYPTKNSGTITLTNCYYTQTLGTDQGKLARNISFNDGVDIDIIPTGISTEYGVSGITGYEGNPCVKYNGTVYAGYNDDVNLTFNHHYVNCEVYYDIF